MYVCVACCMCIVNLVTYVYFCIVISLVAKYIGKFMYFCLCSCMYIYSAREER